jgi:pantoate kinase
MITLESECLSTEDQITMFKEVSAKSTDSFQKENLDKLVKNPDLAFFMKLSSLNS